MAYPVGPVVYAIYVNETLIDDFALDIEFRQQWGHHDLVMVRIEIPRTFTGLPGKKLWEENAPVRIIWGRRPDNILSWFGYVNHRNINSNADSGSKALQITYTLIGTSKPMNTDKTRTWGQCTGTYIAKKIFSEYGFRAVLSKSDWLLPYEVQANESDFKFLNRIADKLGFRFWISGATGYFIDPSVVLYSGATSQGIPNYYLDKRFTQVDTIRQFCMNQGDNLPGATKSKRILYGIDPQSGNVMEITDDANQDSQVTQVFSDWSVDEFSFGKNIIQAKQQRSQFWLSASAELFGNTYIYPGKLIYLTGLQMPQDAQGYWIVGSARHLLKASGTTVSSYDKYVTQVGLIKNEAAIAPSLKGTNKVTPEFLPCKLLNNKWVSTQATVFYDGQQGS